MEAMNIRHNSVRTGESVELQMLFYRLARLIRYSAELIFVFDGNARPSFKHGRTVNKDDHWLTARMQELLTAFGCPWYTVSTTTHVFVIVVDLTFNRHLERPRLSLQS
jgi:Holliday junction resolvase YEN1